MSDIEDFGSLDAYDQYISLSENLPKYDGFYRAKVKSRKCDSDGNLLGSHHYNNFLDNRVYEDGFRDIITNEYAANIIAEHFYSQKNSDGNNFLF